MPANVSIGQKLNNARTPERKIEIINNWLDDWEREQLSLIRRAEHNQHGFASLITLTRKKITALRNMTSKLVNNEATND